MIIRCMFHLKCMKHFKVYYQFHFAGVLSKLEILYVLDVRNVEWNTVVIKEHT